jgi:hypothetical protein
VLAAATFGRVVVPRVSESNEDIQQRLKSPASAGSVPQTVAATIADCAWQTMPELLGDTAAPTDPAIEPLLGCRERCHSCGFTRHLTLRCPCTLQAHPELFRDACGSHTWCANCLRWRLGVDFHAIRTGFIQWRCPVCTGGCPCALCQASNGGWRPLE